VVSEDAASSFFEGPGAAGFAVEWKGWFRLSQYGRMVMCFLFLMFSLIEFVAHSPRSQWPSAQASTANSLGHSSWDQADVNSSPEESYADPHENIENQTAQPQLLQPALPEAWVDVWRYLAPR